MKHVATYKSMFVKADTRDENKTSAATILTCNVGKDFTITDIFQSSNSTIKRNISGGESHILFPVVGSILVNKQEVAANDFLWVNAMLSEELMVQNTYENETVNYLHISLPRKQGTECNASPEIYHLDIAHKNTLIADQRFHRMLQVGVYDSRAKEIIATDPDRSYLVCVINGCFEVDGRLLEHRDTLLLTETEAIDFEALSETSIILIIDCSL